jgi:hypothetical protein
MLNESTDTVVNGGECTQKFDGDYLSVKGEPQASYGFDRSSEYEFPVHFPLRVMSQTKCHKLRAAGFNQLFEGGNGNIPVISRNELLLDGIPSFLEFLRELVIHPHGSTTRKSRPLKKAAA